MKKASLSDIVIIVLLFSNIVLLLYFYGDFNYSNNKNLSGEKVQIGVTISQACIKSELEYTTCSLSIPKNEVISIIYDNKKGWYYGNWEYGKLSVWGWIDSKMVEIKE